MLTMPNYTDSNDLLIEADILERNAAAARRAKDHIVAERLEARASTLRRLALPDTEVGR